MKTGILIQARLGSTRLPSKVMMDILGRPMIYRVVERARACRLTDGVWVATTTDPSDEPLRDYMRRNGIPFTQGSVEDVLGRHYSAAKELGLVTIVRVTSDCPLMDPALVDRMIEYFRGKNLEALFSARLPDGLRAHVLSLEALERCHRHARLAAEREHVVPYIWNHSNQFRAAEFEIPEKSGSYHLSVDYPEDLELVRAVYRRLYPGNPLFGWREVLSLLESDKKMASINEIARAGRP